MLLVAKAWPRGLDDADDVVSATSAQLSWSGFVALGSFPLPVYLHLVLPQQLAWTAGRRWTQISSVCFPGILHFFFMAYSWGLLGEQEMREIRSFWSVQWESPPIRYMGSRGGSSSPCLAYAFHARVVLASCACSSSRMALDLAMDGPGCNRHVLVGSAAASRRDDRGSAWAMATGGVIGACRNLEIRGPWPPMKCWERSRRR